MKLVLSAHNMPAASVVIEADSPPAVVFAARELSRYLAIITGGRFPVYEGEEPEGIALRLRPLPPGPPLRPGEGGERLHGRRSHRSLNDHRSIDHPLRHGGGQRHEVVQGEARKQRGAYAWRVHERGVEISGDRPGAVLHAVYALLETLGCRWLHHRDGGEIVPRQETIELPLGEHVGQPAMVHRELSNLHPIDREYPLHIDWMAKNRLNRFMPFLNIEGSFEAYREFVEPELVPRDMDATLGHHSFRFLLPPEQHFAEHPEWYALIGGGRTPDGQLCTSNPEVVERVARRICDLFDAHPAVEMFGLWPNDGFGWCECAECVAIEPQRPSRFRPEQPRRTDTYLRFVNEVAALVAQAHPDRRLSALAYVNYADAPGQERPTEDVAVCFAPMNRCFKHPLRPDVECDRLNSAYAREFERWREITANDLYLFSYLMQIHTLSLPYPLEPMLQENWRWLIGAGCDGFVMEFVPAEWGALGTNAYLIGRLAWEPELEFDSYLAEHRRLLYGAAADEVAAYRQELIDEVALRGPCTGHYDLTWTRRATERVLHDGLEAFGRARALAAGGEKRHWEAVEHAWVGLELLLRTGRWQRLLRDADEAPEARRASLQRRSEEAARSLLAFARERVGSGAVDAARYERVIGGWLDAR